jgi:hypothetical protein
MVAPPIMTNVKTSLSGTALYLVVSQGEWASFVLDVEPNYRESKSPWISNRSIPPVDVLGSTARQFGHHPVSFCIEANSRETRTLKSANRNW